jgi:DNA-directed RNA polymerase subunit L
VVRLKPSPTGTSEGEEIDVEFRARLGTGRENACWSPTNKCVFGFVRDDKTFDKNFESFLENMRKDFEEGVTLSRDEIARAKDQYSTLQGQRDYAVDVDDNPLAIRFTIETVNRLDPAFVFFEGLRVLSKKVKDLKDEIAKITSKEDDDKGWGYTDVDAEFSATPPRVKIVNQSNMDDMFEITVHQEGHTLGNLVQGLLYRHWNLKGNDTSPKGAAFFGYTEPHPLEDHIVFHIKVNAGDNLGSVMDEGLSWCIKLIDDLSVEFADFANLRKIKVVDETVKSIAK